MEIPRGWSQHPTPEEHSGYRIACYCHFLESEKGVPNTCFAMAVFSQTLDLPIDHARPIKVIVIGAGISGITAAIKLPQTIKNLELSIFEKNEDIGGVWFENKYPGIASGSFCKAV